MLIQELGRFGDPIEGWKPSDFRDAIPPAHRGGRVVHELETQQFALYVPRSERLHDAAAAFLASAFQLPEGGYRVERNIYTPSRISPRCRSVDFWC